MRERSPGVWQLRVSNGSDPLTGERRVVSETFHGSKRAAAAKLAELATDVHRGGDTSSIPLSTAITRWRAAAGHAPGTARNYDLAVATIPAKVARTPIDKIRATLLRTLYDSIIDEHGPHRTRQVHAVISGALTWAWRHELLGDNVARRVQPPAQPKRARTNPSNDEVRRLLHLADQDPQLGAWVRVHAVAGARRQEVIALRWSDVDLRRGQLAIMRAIDPITGAEKAVKADGERTVAIGAATVAALQRWRLAFLERAMAAGAHPVADPYVFTHALDGAMPWRPDYATKRWSRLRRDAAGLDAHGNDLEEPSPIRARLHDVRHYVATEMLSAGVDPKTTAGRLGHSRVATTTDLYGHVIPATDQAAANMLEDRLGS